MLNPLESCEVCCPYCGETLVCQIDTSVEQQHYVEDCHVCCAPIVFRVSIDRASGLIDVDVQREND